MLPPASNRSKQCLVSKRLCAFPRPTSSSARNSARAAPQVAVNGREIGGDEFIVIAGPCSVESEKQIMESAEAVAEAGAHMLRGGAFKPRTSPYDFQGMEEEGLKLLRKAKEATGLAIVTEVMSDRDVELVAEYADVLQIGARNMQNFSLLKTLGKVQTSDSAQARTEFHDEGTADVGRVHRGAWQSERDPVRARHPDLRDCDAEHLRHCGRARC